MSARLNLTLFAHLCGRPEAEIDLAEAALLIAESEYPGLDLARYVRELDDLGRGARAAAGRSPLPEGNEEEARLDRAVRWLYEDAGFHGNDGDYYDPRNSFLSDVIDRRTGIPISLALVLTEVCRRAGIDARGVSFPGHFLVRSDTPRGTILIDPFSGRLLTREDVRGLHARATGEDGDPAPELFEPAPKVQILIRMLNNLRGIYEQRADRPRLRGVIERLHALAPREALRAQVAELGGSEPWRSGGAGVN
jgi:regulator of sirC expression with transglutaminase-like and TPR domain